MRHFGTHIRVVSALVVREMSTRFGGKPGGYMWAILEPAAYIALLTMVFSAISRVPALGSNFPLFFATGFLSYQFYQATSGYVAAALRSNMNLLSYPAVAPIDTLAARLILQTGTSALVAVLVFFTIAWTMGLHLQLNWTDIFEAASLASILAFGVGLMNNVAFMKYPLYEQLFGIVTRPLFMMSGVFFLPDQMPHPYQDVLLFNPLCHVIMLFREGFYPEYRATGLDIRYLAEFSFVALFLGMIVFTFSRATIRGRQ
ncbi:MAG: ABC transporter permease [Shinella sp.]|jgi:capsular polysaccharide transport system permease protein|nr:ABC transporter permease [Shinella sp.]